MNRGLFKVAGLQITLDKIVKLKSGNENVHLLNMSCGCIALRSIMTAADEEMVDQLCRTDTGLLTVTH